jgi:CheY-like chemotaxis protein
MTKKQILIVDDDPDQRLTVRLPLEAAGYTVVEAANFDAGLAAARQTRPDLMILDVMMDSATAGFQLALSMHSPDPDSEFKEFKNIPIIMLTAIHSTTSLRFAPDEYYLPVQDFLEKPVNPEILLATVRKNLDK